MTVVAVAMMIATAVKLTNSTRISGVIFSSTFLFATLLAIFYRAVNPIGWTLVLAGMGYRTPTMGSIRVWLLAESRRWLPGGIWGYASRATQAGQLGVPVSVASASMLIELLITMAAAVLISGVGLLFHHGELTESILKPVVEMLNGRLTGVAVGAFFVCGVIGFAMRRTLHRKLAILLERFKLLAAECSFGLHGADGDDQWGDWRLLVADAGNFRVGPVCRHDCSDCFRLDHRLSGGLFSGRAFRP